MQTALAILHELVKFAGLLLSGQGLVFLLSFGRHEVNPVYRLLRLLKANGILLGVDTVPDMFRTTANVTGDMTVASVIGRSSAPVAVVVPAAAAAPEPVAAGAAAPPAT